MKYSLDVNFKLKSNVNADGSRLIIANVYLNGERLTVSTGASVLPEQWNINTGVLAEKFSSTREGKQISKRLHKVAETLKKAYQLAIDTEDRVTARLLKKRYDELSGKHSRNKLTFFESINKHIARAKNGEIKTADGKPYSDGRIVIYERSKKYLAEYAKRKLSKSELSFEDVLNEDFYNKYKKFLETTEFTYKTKFGKIRRSGNLAANSVGQHIQVLKTFLNAAETYENMKFDFNYSKFFRVTNQPQKKVYLSLEELEKIEKLEIEDDETLNHAREWLLITCFTGLRVSDFQRLKPEHVDLANNTITITAQKTGKPSYVPLFPTVKRIIERYMKNGGFLPRIYAEQVLNRKFKDVAIKANITQGVITVEYVGNKMVEVTVPKSSKIFTKTGRTSFISNMLHLGFSKEQIKKITGHKTDRAFDGYDQLEGETNAKSVLVEFKKRTAKLTAV